MIDPKNPPAYVEKMYAIFVESLEDERWPEQTRDAVRAEIYDLDTFVQALRDRLVVVSAEECPDGLWYTASVQMAGGMQQIARVHGRQLGLDDQPTRDDEAHWKQMQQMTEKPPPDDLSGLS